MGGGGVFINYRGVDSRSYGALLYLEMVRRFGAGWVFLDAESIPPGGDYVRGVWDPSTGHCTATLTGHTDGVTGVAISPDGAWLATTSNDKTVRLWDPSTGATTALTGHTKAVTGVAISPDGTWLATSSNDRSVRVWDLDTGHCDAVLTGHTSGVTGVLITPDGTWLATTSNDKTVRIWDQDTGACVAVMVVEGHCVGIQWTPDGQWIAVAGDSGLYLFDFHAKPSTVKGDSGEAGSSSSST